MPINFTVVPVEDAEGGGSAAAASGAKADRTVPTVVVEDGEAQPAQDSGTSGGAAAAPLLFGIADSKFQLQLLQTQTTMTFLHG